MDKHKQLPRSKKDHLIVHSESRFDEEDLKGIIRQMNLKVTAQRMVILKKLAHGHRHITAQELFEKVNVGNPEIGFATVYRFLRSLAEAQLVTEVRMGGLPTRYELTSKTHHDHLTCTHCGRIVEFENKDIERLQETVAAQFGFTLTHHVLELFGTCPDCLKKLK